MSPVWCLHHNIDLDKNVPQRTKFPLNAPLDKDPLSTTLGHHTDHRTLADTDHSGHAHHTGAKEGMGGGGEITYISLHCHHRNDFCTEVGSDESHLNVS